MRITNTSKQKNLHALYSAYHNHTDHTSQTSEGIDVTIIHFQAKTLDEGVCPHNRGGGGGTKWRREREKGGRECAGSRKKDTKAR